MAEDMQQEEQIKKIVEQVLQDQKQQRAPTATMQPQDQQAAVDCSNSHNIALLSLHYCEQMGGKFTDPENLNLLQDCAESCELMNSFLIRESGMKKDFAELCAKCCDQAVKFAENFPEDSHMQNLLQYAKAASESLKKIK